MRKLQDVRHLNKTGHLPQIVHAININFGEKTLMSSKQPKAREEIVIVQNFQLAIQPKANCLKDYKVYATSISKSQGFRLAGVVLQVVMRAKGTTLSRIPVC